MTLFILILILLAIAAVILGGAYAYTRRGNLGTGKGRGQTIERADRTDSRRFPYRYADGHLFVHGNTVWTGVRFTPVTDEYLSHDELLAMVSQSSRVLKSIAGDEPLPFQVRVTYRPVTASEWATQAANSVWDPTPNYVRTTRRIAEYLTLSETARPETYLLVQIGTVSGARRSDALTGIADEQFDPDEVARWDALATEVHEKLSLMGTTPMTRDDLLWLIRKPLSGHYTPRPVEFGQGRPWGAGEFALAVDFNADNYRNGLLIHHVNDDEANGPLGQQMDSHTAVLLASEWPDSIEFSRRSAWMRFIANLGAQVEINYRGTMVPPHKFLERAEKINGDLTDEANDMAKAGVMPDRQTMLNREAAVTLVEDAKKERMPGVDAQIMLMVSAHSAEALSDVVRQVQNLCRNHIDVTFVRPANAQWRLFESFLPGAAPALAGLPHVQMQEAEVFGVGLPSAGSEVGDNPQQDRSGYTIGWRGDYIGKAGEVPAHYSIPVGLARNEGGGVAIIGASGGGKSSLALLKFHLESEAGTRCVALDPKVDFAQMCYYLSFGPQVNHPGFAAAAADGTLGTLGSPFQPVNRAYWDDTDIIDVLKSKDGVFDAWQISPDVASGEALAQTMLEMFVGEKDWELCRNPVNKALRAVVRDYEERCALARDTGAPVEDVPLPTLWGVVEHVNEAARAIMDDPSAQYADRSNLETAAAVLDALRRRPYSRLAVAQNPAGLGSFTKRRTIFTLRGMETPKTPDANAWTPTQRMAATIMYVLTRITSEMLDVKAERNPVTGRMALRPKALFVDEAYAVTGTETGRMAVRASLAQGRSYNTATVLIDQQAKRLAQIEQDSDDATGNQFHSVFVFKQKTSSEGKAAAPLLGRESNVEAVVQALKPIGEGGVIETGVCLFRDVDSRVATLNVDLVFREMLAATDTNPTTRAIKQSVPVSDNVDDWSFISDTDRAEAISAAEEAAIESEDKTSPQSSEVEPAEKTPVEVGA